MTSSNREPIIKNEGRLLENAVSAKDREARKLALKALSQALEASDPRGIIYSKVSMDDSRLRIGDLKLDLSRFKNLYVIGGGKASGSMAEALEKVLGERVTGGIINVPKGTERFYSTSRILLHGASHPVPDEDGVSGTRKMLEIAEKAGEEDLIICLISGGGSSLMPQPRGDVSLEDKKKITNDLLKCGATINEINAVRKHISDFKGGWLAKKAYPATVVSLLLSDVVGDPLDVIASGPTVPDTSTFSDAVSILKKYRIWDSAPESIRRLLLDGLKGDEPETPKEGDEVFKKVHNIIVGSNRMACIAAKDELSRNGLNTLFLTSYMEGEAREVGAFLASIIRETLHSGNPMPRPCAVVLGGETTVTVVGNGKGGRNQELALAASLKLKGVEGGVLASVNTDGVDGPTDAAGALVDGSTIKRAEKAGLDPVKYLMNNDSYSFFSELGDLIITGPTGTNVTDITVLVVV
ncbi:glycerate kinase [Candidatus Bathyarchaeota archaeon]|nr:glycerate kinase [Candidatus Bathyarchaeota archaeon]